ncbi:MAG: hybrid sensor histidine kinase/response regulator [Synechococcus sp.]|nr:hybrid sensor histidine kinase/response regulator [Synechococcus sp.]
MDSTINQQHRPTILIVDDSPDTLTLISALLKDNYRVKVASRGEQALAIATSNTPPDLILLDVMMPEMDGYEVCRRLKLENQTEHIPVIFLTAKTDIEDEEHGFELGAIDYITKPVSPPILLARVKTHLNLKAAYDHLNCLLKFREDMVNMIVHDLRNPLGTILPVTEMLLEMPDLPQERQQKMLSLVQVAGKQLQTLINDLLLKAKLESDALPLNRQPADLCELCDFVIATAQESPNRKNIKLTAQYPPPPHPQVNVDATLFQRAIANLVANAIKFSPTNSEVIIAVAYSDNQSALITVADQGPGVSPQFRNSIFEKYEIGLVHEGVPQIGLGLAFCKMMVEAHGGTIGVTDNTPKGSIFKIEIPH